jgi:hypothetical protein
MTIEGVAAGAVVKVTLRSGNVQWDGELCTVERVFPMYGQLMAQCTSWWGPAALTCLVPVNEKSVELVAPPVPERAP